MSFFCCFLPGAGDSAPFLASSPITNPPFLKCNPFAPWILLQLKLNQLSGYQS